MPCHRCGRVQTDPQKGDSPWARGVIEGHQILMCPSCQVTDPSWATALEVCPRCSTTRLSVMLGSIVCRNCGFDWPA